MSGTSAFLFAALVFACGDAPTIAGDRSSPAPDAAATSSSTSPDAGGPPISQGDAGAIDGDAGPRTAASCFASIAGPVKGPDYDQFHPTILPSCAGTHHQSITGIERVVFLGDSITTGTPPSLPSQIYRAILTDALRTKFGAIDVADCSQWGAHVGDLLSGQNQFAKCFPNDVDDRKTLVVMTDGGNDVASWVKDGLDADAAMAAADGAIAELRTAIHWLKDPARFPKGVNVVMANVYEYTDTSGNLDSCPAASASGLHGNWSQGAAAVVHLQEQMMQIAVETGSDLVFLLEDFCGHGYERNDPSLQCYRGAGAELWFDLTCYHPDPAGHAEIARLFQAVIDG